MGDGQGRVNWEMEALFKIISKHHVTTRDIGAKAEQQLQMVEEQRKIDEEVEESQKIKCEQEKRTREEQKIILGKDNARPKISFSI
ncbi:hypothetical protein Pmani_009423 [Petrolisthes manimaculis]|uniref:Uncharacterized protein n=1 Tax=Petrolisthes manimaculis TaxID=1843537 RepID=A0AAE1UIE2_9EUCA|nr:hypothetical protein Pmani_009423 [Petrolisthes manimaculis]